MEKYPQKEQKLARNAHVWTIGSEEYSVLLETRSKIRWLVIACFYASRISTYTLSVNYRNLRYYAEWSGNQRSDWEDRRIPEFRQRKESWKER